MKTFRNTIIMLLILGVLAGYYYYAKSTKKPAPSTNIINISKSKISSVDIKDAGNELAIEKSGSTYNVTKPVSYKADSTSTDDLFNSISGLKYSRKFTDTDVRKYGLDKSDFTISVSSKDGKNEELLVGNKSPVGDSYYAKLKNSNYIYVVDASSIENFQITSSDTLFNYLDKDVYTMSKDKISKITYTDSTGTYNIEKNKSGKWVYNGKEISSDNSEALLNDIVLLNPTGIDPNKKIVGNNSSFTLTISDGNKSEEVKFLTNDNATYYLQKNATQIGLYISKDQLSSLLSDIKKVIK
ncbi:hypothetical protein Thexy_0498 [Thermoanaerobacterium xylanolyticum LX-11]|uniref:DUF4340 domain-containing protein n=1 Tax=Thermoanaerobacterium xylanolyticum (strain ATCC 49914 / DSM 7097 / LX-11) TaxID=858215 RepID=F6BHG9_THEXL|nr:DUF4340 domain-containing protein [Thermoanaerobacterium xylanolyticum]AEF16550.1 hypothetical protein Thexy_0498 [Thermoanaerobacterium xylanolyticum LX-11]